MAELIRMPEVAAGAEDATLVSWALTHGQSFAVSDVIAVVETAKAIVEIEAEQAGVLVLTLVEAGAEVRVGEPIALVAAAGESITQPDALLATFGIHSGTQAPAQLKAEAHPTADGAEFEPALTERVFASPLARQLASGGGLTLKEISGSGPGGRIVRADVNRALAAKTSTPRATPIGPAAPAELPTPGFTDVPHSRSRRVIAARLGESNRLVPNFWIRAGLDVEDLLSIRAQINAVAEVKVSVNDLVVKAVAAAFVGVADANVIWTDTAVRKFDRVDLALAVAGPHGLVAPVVRDVASLSITALSRQIQNLTSRAQQGRLRQSELEGGNCTVSNLGMYSVDEFSAIINPPHSTILAVGAAAKRAVVGTDGQITARSTMNVVLSVDHRAIDGVLAATWMKAFRSYLENPLGLLL